MDFSVTRKKGHGDNLLLKTRICNTIRSRGPNPCRSQLIFIFNCICLLLLSFFNAICLHSYSLMFITFIPVYVNKLCKKRLSWKKTSINAFQTFDYIQEFTCANKSRVAHADSHAQISRKFETVKVTKISQKPIDTHQKSTKPTIMCYLPILSTLISL